MIDWLIDYFSFTRFQPGVEDKEMYKKYKGDKTNLQPVDQFLIKVSKYVMNQHSIKTLIEIHVYM